MPAILPIPEYVRRTLGRLTAAGHCAYLVGGCVRDLLRGVMPADYDAATDASPARMMEIFADSAHPTGLQHGTVTVLEDGHTMEITTFRREGAYTDHRRPDTVTFTDDITEDLRRRDFTVNAMALSVEGELLDPYGGQADLSSGILRCVGDAALRFEEDALRILRLLRFAACLGFSVDSETKAAAVQRRRLIRTLAAERVYHEWTRMLCGGWITDVLLQYPTVLGEAVPEILPCVGFDQRNAHHCYDVWEHTAHAVGAIAAQPVLRWTMLFHDLGKPSCFSQDEAGVGHFYGHTSVSAALAEDIMQRLRFPRALTEDIRTQLCCFDDYFPAQRAAVHTAMAQRGKEVIGRLLQTKLADNAAKAPEKMEKAQQPWLEARALYGQLCAEGACCSLREMALGGEELLTIGFTGADIGAVLQRLLREVAAEKIPNTHMALYERAKRLYRSGYHRTGKCIE